MRILFDLQHPAHLHFFRNVIRRLNDEGHTVKVTGRDKDILVELAGRYGVETECFGAARKGIINLSCELLYRQWRLYSIIKEFRPDLMMAIAGTFISLPGRLLRIPVYVFYDTECATISNLLSYPFATCVYVPRCYRKRLHVRHVRYDGYHELAYLHPNYFRADPAVLSEVNLAPGDIFTIVRFVGWGAAHDIGKKGFSDKTKTDAIRQFERFGKVFISSEAQLPSGLAPYRLPVSVEKAHHLMSYASLVFGESATMASEAAVMGVPAVYLDPVGRGYTDEQEKKYGIVFNFTPGRQTEAVGKGVELLRAADRRRWRGIGERIVRESEDVTKIIYNVALRRPYTAEVDPGRKETDGSARKEYRILTEDSLANRCRDILLRSASHFRLPLVPHEDVPAGGNGPHGDRVNNLRIISHLTVLSYYLYKSTGERDYRDWVRASIPYIEKFKDPQTGVYINRDQPGKDPNNGLIGQAWVIQALLYVLDILKRDEIDRMILDVIESHRFDAADSAYMYPVRDGRHILFLPDFTLNHQIWFSSIIRRSQGIGTRRPFQEEQKRFLAGLEDKIRPKGDRINHTITQKTPTALKVKWMANNPRKLSTYLWRQMTGNYRSMEAGYLPFSLWGIYGDDELYNAVGNRKSALDAILERYVCDTALMRDDNPFAWGYNMHGIEISISYLRRFGRLGNEVLGLLTKQLEPPLDYAIADFTTYMARHYELVYLIEALEKLEQGRQGLRRRGSPATRSR